MSMKYCFICGDSFVDGDIHTCKTQLSQPPTLTHRQWLAGMAMQGMADRLNGVPEHRKHSVKHVTELAYAVADAMIEHEQKEKNK